MIRYACPICDRQHDDLPRIGSDRPVHYWDVAEQERGGRIKLTSDTCEIDGKHFFARGVIEIPVIDYPDGFGFGVWVSHKEENYRMYLQYPDSAEIGPFFGWLCTRISYYSKDTELLKTTAHYRRSGMRPTIELQASDHPLTLPPCGKHWTKNKELASFLRQRRGVTPYAAFARKLGMTRSSLFRLENGQQSITLKRLQEIIDRLRCDIRDIFPRQR
jgi:DNA-binding XRE family transcriptional regulator